MAMFLVSIAACAQWRKNTLRHNGIKRLDHVHATHYFISPSAIPIERGEGWFKSTLIAFNQAAYGISERWGVNAGMHLPSVFSNRAGGPVWFGSLRYSGAVSGRLHLGLNASYLRAALPSARTETSSAPPTAFGFGSLLCMATIGSSDHNASVAVGATHDGERFGRGPLLTVAASSRLFPNVCVITEHWFVVDPDGTWPVHSLGIRVLGSDMALDVGLAYERRLAQETLPVGLPFASATFNF